MKLSDILTETTSGLPKKPKARPNKTLWYNHSGLWMNDLDQSRAGYTLHSSEDEEEESIYAMDPDCKHCYGSWNKKKNMGVTFASPRPKHAVIHPRTRIKPFQRS